MPNLKLSIIIFFILISSNIFSQTLFPVSNVWGKYGFIDSDKDTIIECIYDFAEEFSDDLALVKNSLQFKVIDTAGVLYDLGQLKYTEKFRFDIGEGHSGLPIIIRVWDCQYLNKKGEVELEIPYTDAESFINGTAKVYDGDLFNFIDKDGILLFEWKKNIDYDYRPVQYNDKYGYINLNGKLVIDYQYIVAKDFTDGVAIIGNGLKWAIINTSGKIISEWYDEISDFIGEVAIISEYKKYGFLDKTGKLVSQGYTTAQLYSDSLFLVTRDEKFGFVNTTGNLVTQWYDEVYGFEDGYCKVRKDEKYANLNTLGALVMGWYEEIGDFKEGYVKVYNNGEYSVINHRGIHISDWYPYIDDFTEGFAVVKSGKFYGYMNKNGDIIVDFQFDKAEPFNQGLAMVQKDSLVAFIDKTGSFTTDYHRKMIYYSKTPPKGLVLLKIGKKYGFQSLNGTIIIPCKHDYAENFSDDLALIKNNSKEMYIDIEGNLHEDFSDNDSLRRDWGNGHTGQLITLQAWDCAYIDQEGKIVLEVPYSNAYSFYDDEAQVEIGDKYNFIDTSGTLLYEWKEYDHDYHAIAGESKFGYINKNNVLVIDYLFDYAEDFKDGIAKVRIGDRKTGKYGFIDKTGKLFSELYNEVSEFEDGISIVESDGKFAVIDGTGKVLSSWYSEIRPFVDDYSIVMQSDRYSFINKEGKQITLLYEKVYPFSEERAKIYNNGRWGFIDKNGKLVVPTIYDAAWDFNGAVAKIKKDNKYAFIDNTGEVITDWYERVNSFSNGYALVYFAGKWGYINTDGELAIECKFDQAFAFTDGKAIVINEGESYYINKKGEKIGKVDE
jgi:hypothetical protein